MLRVILERSGGSVIVGYQMTTTKLARETHPNGHCTDCLPCHAGPRPPARACARGAFGGTLRKISEHPCNSELRP